MHKIIFFPEKSDYKKICVPTVPKIFRHVTGNTLIFFLFGLIIWRQFLILPLFHIPSYQLYPVEGQGRKKNTYRTVPLQRCFWGP